MSKVEKIERAIEELSKSEFMELRDWILERDWQSWDTQIERDAEAGKLDELVGESREDYRAGRTARAVSEIEKEIRGLATGDQERLLRALVEELDGPPDPEAERAWKDEVQRRSRELDDGTVKSISANDVFAKARADLER